MADRLIVVADATYGSDQAGMVCAYAFAPGRPGRAVGFEEAAALLATPGERPEFLWLHFSLANSAAGRWLRIHTPVPEFDLYDSSKRAPGSPEGFTNRPIRRSTTNDGRPLALKLSF